MFDSSQNFILPLKYLGGMDVTYSNLKTDDWDFQVAKFIKKLDAWICDSASSGARLTLLDSCLTGIPSYYMSMHLLHKKVVEKLDKYRQRFLWARKKRAYHMVKRGRVCRSKSKGGFDVNNL